MKNIIPILAILLLTAGCNRKNAEEVVQGYLLEKLGDLKDQLPDELKMLDSLLLDSTLINRKIGATTNIDSLKKYNELLIEAKKLLKKDISTLNVDSISPEIRQILETNR